MRLIFGLGNPGPACIRNRHNLGFMAVDRAASAWKASFETLECQALTATVRRHGEEALLAKPLTFMNAAGHSAVRLKEKYGLKPEEIIVVYDDIDLPIGTIRIRRSGGAGFHRGVLSLIEKLGTEEFVRLRLGILGTSGYDDLSDFVLSDFETAEMDRVGETLERSVEALEMILTSGLEAAMRVYNAKTQL